MTMDETHAAETDRLAGEHEAVTRRYFLGLGAAGAAAAAGAGLWAAERADAAAGQGNAGAGGDLARQDSAARPAEPARAVAPFTRLWMHPRACCWKRMPRIMQPPLFAAAARLWPIIT